MRQQPERLRLRVAILNTISKRSTQIVRFDVEKPVAGLDIAGMDNDIA